MKVGNAVRGAIVVRVSVVGWSLDQCVLGESLVERVRQYIGRAHEVGVTMAEIAEDVLAMNRGVFARVDVDLMGVRSGDCIHVFAVARSEADPAPLV